METFKEYTVGQKVKVKSLSKLRNLMIMSGRIISGTSEISVGSGINFVNSMQKCCDVSANIVSISPEYGYRLSCDRVNYYHDWMVEPVEEVT